VTPLARDFRQHLGQGLAGAGLHVSMRAEEKNVGRADLASEKPQQEQRGRVGGVQVVHEEDERPTFGGPAKELCDGVEEPEACRFRLQRARRRQIGEPLVNIGDDLCELDGPGAELRPESVGRRLPDVGA
jgi:hypothetical protein